MTALGHSATVGHDRDPWAMTGHFWAMTGFGAMTGGSP